MADTGVFCSEGSVLRKAGANVNPNVSGAITNQFIGEAESMINNATRINYTDTYSGLNDDTKKTLQQAASDMAGIYAINYDMTDYNSTAEAETMVDILRDRFIQAISILKEKKATDFINGS